MRAPLFVSNKTQLLALAIASVTQAFCSYALAAPEGGQVVAGQGAIEQIEKETRIQQASERLSLDWKSFDVNSDECVQFIQPNSSSIAFNHILSNKGSLIQGRIDANGQVVLINPDGQYSASRKPEVWEYPSNSTVIDNPLVFTPPPRLF